MAGSHRSSHSSSSRHSSRHSSSHHSSSSHGSHSASHHSSHHYHGSGSNRVYLSHRTNANSPFSCLHRDEVYDYEEFMEANGQTVVETNLTNEESVMPVRDDAGNPLSQRVEAETRGDDSINIDNEGLVMHATWKTNATGSKIKIDSPKVPYREYGINDALIYGRSWVIDDAYAMDTRDSYFVQNYKGNKKSADPGTRFAIMIVCMVICEFFALIYGFHKMFIGIFEDMYMSDFAFYLVDDLLFYGQYLFPFVVVLLEYLRFKRKHKKNLMFTAQMIKSHLVDEEKSRFEMTHEFLPVCPNCGASRQDTDMYCIYCGANLLRNSADIN